MKRGVPQADVTLLNNIAYGVDGDIVGDPTVDNGFNLVTGDLGGPGRPITDFLADPAAGDYRLAAGSPAADAGLPIPDALVPGTDFEGEQRVNPSDVGWDELLPDLDRDFVADPVDNCPPIPGDDAVPRAVGVRRATARRVPTVLARRAPTRALFCARDPPDPASNSTLSTEVLTRARPSRGFDEGAILVCRARAWRCAWPRITSASSPPPLPRHRRGRGGEKT